jgi:aspartokinase-like uncharacterized kinase
VIVGGGRGADFLRELDLLHGIGEKRSHALAMGMLELTARIAAAIVPGLEVVEILADLPTVWARGVGAVLNPRIALEDDDRGETESLPHSWAVTSDSIAARVADRLGARELRLFKSRGLHGVATRSEAARSGLVDAYFPAAAARWNTVTVINLRSDPPTEEQLA